MAEQTRRFQTRGENGRIVVVLEFTALVDVTGSTDPVRCYQPSKRYETEEGKLQVLREAKGRYRIYKTGEILTSDDPDAP